MGAKPLQTPLSNSRAKRTFMALGTVGRSTSFAITLDEASASRFTRDGFFGARVGLSCDWFARHVTMFEVSGTAGATTGVVRSV